MHNICILLSSSLQRNNLESRKNSSKNAAKQVAASYLDFPFCRKMAHPTVIIEPVEAGVAVVVVVATFVPTYASPPQWGTHSREARNFERVSIFFFSVSPLQHLKLGCLNKTETLCVKRHFPCLPPIKYPHLIYHQRLSRYGIFL